MKIRTMLILLIIAFSLTSTIFFTSYESSKIHNIAEARYNDKIVEITKKQEQNVNAYFESAARQVELLASNILLENCFKSEPSESVLAEVSELLTSFCGNSSNIKSILIYDANFNAALYTDPNLSRYLNPSVINEYKDYTLYVFNDTERGNNNNYGLLSKAKIRNTDATLVVVFDNRDMTTLFDYSRFPTNGRIILIDPELELLDSTYMDNLNNITVSEYLEYKRRIITEDFTEGFDAFSYEIGKSTRLATLTNISDSGWKLAAVAESENAYTYSSNVTMTLVNWTIIMAILCIILDIISVIFFTRPLYIIEETLIKIHRGDHEARINILANNEYGDIAKSFNDLLDDVVVSEGRYRTIVEMSDNIILEWNFTTGEVSFSNNFNKKFSYRAPSERFEDSFLVKCKVHPDDAARYRSDLDKLSRGEEVSQCEYRWKNIYGDYIWILLRTSVIYDKNNEIAKVVGVIIDIDRAKKSEKILTTRASFDALTTLYNRETVESLINNEIDLVTVRKNEFAILFVDVDDFKQYNDNYSHATGDQVLRFTALTIQEIIENFGIAGRYGGDEFVICIRNSQINDPARVSQEILIKLKEGFVCDVGDQLSVAVSIGIAIIRDSSKRVDEIIGLADDAMYKIKKSGKSNYGFINQ